jgi:hypothetical protein
MTNYEATPSTPFRRKGQALRFDLCDFWEWAYHEPFKFICGWRDRCAGMYIARKLRRNIIKIIQA